MTRQEHLMTIAMEECNELAHRISKAMRFGLLQVQQDADDRPEENPERLSNRMRIRQEFSDLVAVLEMIDRNLVIADILQIAKKKDRVERYLLRSRDNGTLTK